MGEFRERTLEEEVYIAILAYKDYRRKYRNIAQGPGYSEILDTLRYGVENKKELDPITYKRAKKILENLKF